MEIANEKIQTLAMDHHGIIAAVCKDLKIAERIDKKVFDNDPRQVVTPGQAAVAMILNGLGFTNRRLYLTHQFFNNKPIDRLIDQKLQSEDITDYTLSHTLDVISKYGSSKLFGEVAFSLAVEENLLGNVNHLDSTSISVEGEYKKEAQEETDEPSGIINITYGHSKDMRPDLKQLVLSLVMNGDANIPLWMDPLNGNSSDKTSFHETIKKVKDFQKQINIDENFKWIADSALYSKKNLLKNNDYLWVTRVPESIKEAKELVKKLIEDNEWKNLSDGYKYITSESSYGDIKQRWLLVYSQQAYAKESKTFYKNLDKQENSLKKAIKKLSKQEFENQEAAKKEMQIIIDKYKLFDIKIEINQIYKHTKAGRPKPGDQKELSGYGIRFEYKKNNIAIIEALQTKGKFILATNDLDDKNYTDTDIFNEYKQQQNVEGGFRFLKDPWFMLDSVFLKLPSRIEALMMIMTLCLLVYNVAQYRMRKALEQTKETIPNQKKKQTNKPTMRWLFLLLEGIGIIKIYDDLGNTIREIITNIDALRKKIIGLFGENTIKMYGMIAKNA